MKFQISTKDSVTLLVIDGQLDAMTVPDLRGEIDKVVESAPTRVDVDLTNLRLIDSSGVGALVSLYKRMRAQGGKVEIKGLRDQPLAIFRLLRLDRVLIGAYGRSLLKAEKHRKSQN
jgi:anti-sigma B factor antagonist